jgi:hypothetical protein
MMIFAYRSQLVFLFYVPLPGNVGALYAEICCGSGEGYIELFSPLQHHRILYSTARHQLLLINKQHKKDKNNM